MFCIVHPSLTTKRKLQACLIGRAQITPSLRRLSPIVVLSVFSGNFFTGTIYILMYARLHFKKIFENQSLVFPHRAVLN